MRYLPEIPAILAPRRRARSLRVPALLLGVLLTAASVASAPAIHAGPPDQRNFAAHATGEEEVPPVDTDARGQLKLQLSKDGTKLRYRLNVANIEDVTMAHLHQAPAGANGPVVVWLYPDSPPPEPIPGRTDGVLATGTVTEDDLVGPMEGRSMSDLAAELADGNIYVNVHTEQHPPGEIRGQLR
ncbi:CHRD domain-containing protein [Haloechinothrix sp. YIM 98757]|uniref:CHRD domain-containing protein n=1 Tax=Haloechinothrix aidingensis TaxID=2752311 RepID=A0A837ZW62_9PSEU|nr:CHRD domain-containing protein [Haloechinothrix aidingensis]MBA0124344.1 CHRD domain-containing protein [Haloechinothrix aidingensis]